MNCNTCDDIGFSGNSKVCGYLLHGGETVFVKNGQINEACPRERASQPVSGADRALTVDHPIDCQCTTCWQGAVYPGR